MGVTDTKIRLLRCDNCKTLEELPDFDGPPEKDVLLEVLLSRHETDGHRHTGRLFDVPERAWNMPNIRKEILDQLKHGSSGLAMIVPDFYDVRDTFKDDALKCFHLHNRPSGGCSDYKSDKKMLLPNTSAERKELGLSKPGKGSSPVHYLCSWCPVDSYVQAKRRGDG